MEKTNLKEQQSSQFLIQDQQTSQNKIKPTQISQFSEYYNKFITTMGEQAFRTYITKIKLNQIYVQQQKFHQIITIKVKKQSMNSVFVGLQVLWGKFKQNITIMNTEHDSKVHKIFNLSDNGAYARIYANQGDCQNQLAIKCIPYQSQSLTEKLVVAIQECFLLKLASELKFGPYYPSDNGVDIVVNEQCIEFAMQKCLACYKIQQISNIENFNKLKLQLQTMHSFNIFHLDIKPQNIMYSYHHKKLIFIDFNLSDMIEVMPGEKIRMHFRGTLQFCYSQMMQMFNNKKIESAFIDPFYCDAFALRKTLIQLDQIANLQIVYQLDELQIADKQRYMNFYNYINLLKLKYLLFEGHWAEAQKCFLSNQLTFHISDIQQLVYFCSEIQPKYGLKKFYNYTLKEEVKQSFDLQALKRLLSFKNYFSIFQIVVDQNKKRMLIGRLQSLKDKSKTTKKCNFIYRSKFTYKINKDTILQIMNSQLTTQPRKIFSLLNAYFQMISYTCNIHDSNRAQRIKYASSLIQKFQGSNEFLDIIQRVEKQSIDQDVIAKSVMMILEYCNWLSDHFLSHPQKRKEVYDGGKRAHQNLRQLYVNIIDHLFILDIGSNEYFINSLTHILANQIFDDKQKLLLCMVICQNNIWNHFYINSKKGQTRHDRLLRVKNLYRQWFYKLDVESSNNNIRQLLSLKNTVAKILKEMQFQNQLYEQLQLSLQVHEITVIRINFESFQDMSLWQSYSRFKMSARTKFYPFILQIIDLNLTHHKVQMIQLPFRLLLKNINDETILNRLSVYKNYECFKVNGFHIQCKWQILRELDNLDFMLQINLVIGVLNQLNCLFQKQDVLQKYLQKFQPLISRLIQFAMFLLDHLGSYQHHDCSDISFLYISTIFGIYCLKQYTQPASYFSSIVSSIKTLGDRFDCHLCKNKIYCYRHLLILEDLVISNRSQNQQIIVKLYFLITQFLDDWRKYFQYKFQINQFYFLTDAVHYYLMVFCANHETFQEKYHGIQNLYLYRKIQGRMIKYFQVKVTIHQQLFKIMQTLYKHGIAKFCQLLKQLGQIINQSYSQMSSKLLLQVFKAFFETKVQKKQEFALKMLDIDNEKQYNQKMVIIYYYFLFNLEPSESIAVILKCLKRLCENLDKIAINMRYQFTCQIYAPILRNHIIWGVVNARKFRFYLKKMLRVNARLDKKRQTAKVRQFKSIFKASFWYKLQKINYACSYGRMKFDISKLI